MTRRDSQLAIRASADDLERWRRAAARAGVSLSAWVRAQLDAGAKLSERPGLVTTTTIHDITTSEYVRDAWLKSKP